MYRRRVVEGGSPVDNIKTIAVVAASNAAQKE
jgi:hypothetical protein